jgi:putative glutamine amidotransferase
VEAILELQKPALGICRGIQVINTALGGTLIEHIPDEIGEAIKHRLPPREPAEHEVIVKTGSRLAEILRQTRVVIASVHHQAIRKVAPRLEIVAEAPDGTIEAVELNDHPWLVAVQWHPELTSAKDPIQQRLFDAFVQAAREFG